MSAIAARNVIEQLRLGGSARAAETASPRFKTGDRVRVINRNPEGHTRAPRYVRGRVGIIVHDHGVFVFPDTHAHGRGKSPQHVYSVRFETAALWGPEMHAPDSVYVDLWDPYLERAEA